VSGTSKEPQQVEPRVICRVRSPPSRDGILFGLTKKYGGHVHEQEIVTVTSSSVAHDAAHPPESIADLIDASFFGSQNTPGQWVCWDFQEMRVRLTHYTFAYVCYAANLTAWRLESSLDGENWVEIDRRIHVPPIVEGEVASFAIPNPVESRFIRLTQTEKNHTGDHMLRLDGVEFHGKLYEPKALSAIRSALPELDTFRPLVQCPFIEETPLNGIISYLTQKYGGNVHEKQIIQISSKSFAPEPWLHLRSVATLVLLLGFASEPGPDQWVCWDFHELRICPTQYAVDPWELNSWVVESSLDGEYWTEIDRRIDQHCPRRGIASFEIADPLEARFIRLSIVPSLDHPDATLQLRRVEFFGTVFEH
jgi:hypothetical protein